MAAGVGGVFYGPTMTPAARTTSQAVVVERQDGAYRVTLDREVSIVPRPALASLVRDLEAGRPRWVWDTARVYPGLLADGVRVDRAWDLRLVRAILRRATGLAVDAAAWTPDAWDDEAGAEEDGTLPIDVAQPTDAVAEFARQSSAVEGADRPGALRLLVTAESAGALAAAEMRHAGVPWRRDVHERILADLLGPRVAADRRPEALERLAGEIRDRLGAPRLNPDSGVELARALRTAGIDVDSTRASALRGIDHPAVTPLLEYKKLARLHQANGWHWLDTWVQGDRFRPDYIVGGVVTGRWATRGGGALQLPKQIRAAVVADTGWRLVVADAAQLEPRVLAGLAKDRSMAEAGRGRDLYDGIVASGAVATRANAKLGMLGALYGATSGEGGRLVPRLAQRFPRALALVERAAREGERGAAVHTLLGRTTPPVSDRHRALDVDAAVLDADDAVLRAARSMARDRGRFTRNFVVQGTAAEWALCWLADLRRRLWVLGDGALGDDALVDRPHLVYFLHDEVVVHTPAALAGEVATEVQRAAAAAGRLLFDDFPIDFPLEVAVVERYADAG